MHRSNLGILFVSFLLMVALCSFSFGQPESKALLCVADSDEVFAKPTHLTRPNYPPAAVAVRATGDVVVFVTVTPDGKVSSTSIQDGHPLLRKASETAASETTFEPIKRDCQRLATLIFTFLAGPPESDEKAINSPFHIQIFAKERPVRKRVDGKDPCKDLRFLAANSEAPTLSTKDALEYPECVEGKLVRLYGIYSAGFEGSVFSDLAETGYAWVEMSPFYPVAKKCSNPEALKIWNSPDRGTFGLVALGTLRTGGGFGHMNGWDNEFQIMCIEEMKKFSKETVLFKYQKPAVQKQIVTWYNTSH